MLSVIKTTGLGEHRRAWDELVAIQPLPSPYLLSWWLEAGAQGKPAFFLVTEGEGERLVGGMALQEEQWRGMSRYRVMGERFWPSHFDLIAAPDLADQVIEVLTEWMSAIGPSVFELYGVAADSRLRATLPGSVQEKPMDPVWCGELTVEASDLLASKSKKFRSEVRRVRRRVGEAGLTERVVPPVELERALGALEALHTAQFGEASTFLPNFDQFAAAARRGVGHNAVVFIESVDRDGQTVAVDVWLRAGSRCEVFAGGRDTSAQSGAGVALLASALEYAGSEGFTEFDLGTDFEGWKSRWATFSRDRFHVVSVSGLRARLTVAARDLLLGVRRRVRRGRRSS